jgi:hypothetical protein
MWQYLLYFLIGGALVAAIAYVGNHHGGWLAAVVTSVPVVFLLGLVLIYRNGGVGTSVEYVRGTLTLLPVFVAYAILTIWLLPRMHSLVALLPGLMFYLVPVYVIRRRRRDGVVREGQVISVPYEPAHESQSAEVAAERAVRHPE